jgi:hypothetical protein
MKLLIATPTYDGGVRHAEALVALERGGPRPKTAGALRPRTSLLCYARNLALAQAANEDCTHLLYLDADVEPLGEDWFMVLYDEMQRSGAQILGGVVALKDGSGETSIAVDHGDIYNPVRYTLQDLQGRRTWSEPTLRVSTGCMLLDLSGEWWQGLAFSTSDLLGTTPDGQRVAITAPEDYIFCAAAERLHRITIAATTAIQLVHWDGGTAYPNWVD